MNLIEISEQLKDVPDNFLMKEVQAPSGAYPAYLVVTELTRRKRMRESAVKEEPQTTVAEDLTQPSREEIMAAMARMQQAQMPPMAQPMSQPAPSLNAGLMATPQAAQEIAAQDAMAAMPQRQPVGMAGGGMVAFKHGGNVDEHGVIRAFDGFPEEMFTGTYEPPVKKYPDEIEAYRPGTFSTLFGMMPEGIGAGNIDYELGKVGYSKSDIASMDPAMKRYIVAQVQAGGQTAKAQQGQKPSSRTELTMPKPAPQGIQIPNIPGAAFTDPFADLARKNIEALQAARNVPPAVAEQQAQAARQAGLAEYERLVPDRTSPAIEEIIAKQSRDIEGRRGSNINEALIQAGLGIMGSKSPRFLQAAGQAGTEALGAYRQGLKDIREGERLLMQSKVDLAKAQSLHDQNKFGASEKAYERYIDTQKRGIDNLNTESAIIARNQQANVQAHTARLAGLELPYKIARDKSAAEYSQAMADLTRAGGAAANRPLSASDIEMFEAKAKIKLKQEGIEKPTQAQINAKIQEMRSLGRGMGGMSFNDAMSSGWSVNQ